MPYPYLLECESEPCGHRYAGDLTSCPKCGMTDMMSHDASLYISPRDYTYDIETYPNVFTCAVTHISSGTKWRFEISPRINQINELITFMYQQRDINARHVGYNNVGFDYPVIHFICMNPFVTWVEIYNKAMSIIGSNDRWSNNIWERDRVVEQLDLFKLHHFDNVAKSTSLKALEFAMLMDNIEDLPFEVGTVLTDDQIDELHIYNGHDVEATTRFYIRSLAEISLRESLSKQYRVDMVNFSDSKIGSRILITQLEEAGIQCFDKSSGRKQPRQTIRAQIALGDVIFPYVKLEHPDFARVMGHIKAKTITETKGIFDGLVANVDGLEYKFGTGGLHAAVDNSVYESDDDMVIEMRDVVSYYPRMSIVNKVYPEHLGDGFCDVYGDLFTRRRSFKKGTPENAALKIALNATYGNSNNQYSPLYDPMFTMTITINGQLMLSMLSEQLVKTPGLRMINVNTDGVGFIYPRKYRQHIDTICSWWEKVTGLELETDVYSKFCQRDVNNYIGVQDGKIKRKGAYEYNRNWHQDSSAMIIPKAAEAALVRGEDIETFIRGHRNPFDFCLRAKVPRSNKLMMRWEELDIEMQLGNIIRYFVSTNGGSLVKFAPPTGKAGTWKRKPRVTEVEYQRVLSEITSWVQHADAMGGIPSNGQISYDGVVTLLDIDGTPHDERIHTKNKSKHAERRMSIGVGYLATDCSDISNFDWSSLNYDYYIAEARKLVEPLLTK